MGGLVPPLSSIGIINYTMAPLNDRISIIEIGVSEEKYL